MRRHEGLEPWEDEYAEDPEDEEHDCEDACVLGELKFLALGVILGALLTWLFFVSR